MRLLLWAECIIGPYCEATMRDHRKLRAFELADELVIAIYRATKLFPKEELFGLTSQLHRTAVLIGSNIVEDSARNSLADYIRLLDIAFASTREVEYQISIAGRLRYFEPTVYSDPQKSVQEDAKVMAGLIRSLRSDRQSHASSLRSHAF